MLASRVPVRTAAIAALGLLAFALARPVAAQPQPADQAKQPADQATIDRRIEMGVKFLKKQQKPAGQWGDSTGAAAVGYTALSGLALVECGVPISDPGIKKAAALIRQHANELDSTYELALAILFLDRMKEKTDRRYIHLLAGRLIASQMPSGGWGYKAQKYSEPSVTQMLIALRKLSTPPAPPAPPPDLGKVRAGLPEDIRRLAVLNDSAPGRLPADAEKRNSELLDATTDNSNTHFAMIGLWTARKHDVPVDRTFALVNRRFRTSQGPGGTWGYGFVRTGADAGGPFTCVALLGVAIGHVVAPEPGVKPEADPIILNAFVALSKTVGEPVGDTQNRPKLKDVGGLYFMWAMERIAVLYDLRKLGNKDWYLWGAEILISNQLADGSWEEGGFPGESPVVNTCFALMFLRRANLTPDLSKKLVVDPSVLAAKVDDKITPKVEPPPPTPKVAEPEPIQIAPPPRTVEPKIEPPPAPAPAPEPAATTPAKKSPWLWIVLGMLFAAIVGGGLAFFLLKRRNKDEDADAEDGEGEKKKKKGKKKPKAATDKPEKPEGGKKAKPVVEVDEDE